MQTLKLLYTPKIVQTSKIGLFSFFILLLVACSEEGSTPAPSANEIADLEEASDETEAPSLSESEQLTVWLDEQYEEQLQFSPMTLTRLGRKELYDQIDDASESALQERLDWLAASVEEMANSFDYEALTDDARLSYDLWHYQYVQQENLMSWLRHSYVFEQMNGEHSGLPTFLISYHGVDTLSDMEAYIIRIGGISNRIEQLMERAQLAADEGVRPPHFSYEIVMQQSADLLNGMPFEAENEVDSPLLADAKTKITALFDDGLIDEAQAEALVADTEAALLEHFQPAYLDLIAWLDEDIANAGEEAQGVWTLPDGEAFYNDMLSYSTTTDLTADEIHEIGLAEVERIKGEIAQIMEEVEFEGSMAEFFDFIRTDEQFLYPNTDEGRQAFLDETETFLDTMYDKLPEAFGTLPKAGLEVRRVEAFREEDGAPAHYYPGAPDGSRDGIYYAHLSDMAANPSWDMETVAYHEGVPGHHMQISIQQELTSVPQFRTQYFAGAYVEGWALYSEKLAKEMGAFETPYNDFGRLNAEIWRAVRLVVDTGLHSKGWSQEQAVEYFLANTAIAESAVRAEVRRYLVMPGQATSYKIGMLKIQELRERAEVELGADFDLSAYHDVVLGNGALPLIMLDDVVDRWIEEVKAGAGEA